MVGGYEFKYNAKCEMIRRGFRKRVTFHVWPFRVWNWRCAPAISDILLQGNGWWGGQCSIDGTLCQTSVRYHLGARGPHTDPGIRNLFRLANIINCSYYCKICWFFPRHFMETDEWKAYPSTINNIQLNICLEITLAGWLATELMINLYEAVKIYNNEWIDDKFLAAGRQAFRF